MRIIFSVLWTLVKVAVVVAIVVFGLSYYANHSQSAFAQTVSNTLNSVSTVVSGQTGDSDWLTDTFTNRGNARWSKTSATVYIETQNQTLIAAYQEAIEVWNSTGAFTFELVTDKSQVNIVLGENSNGQTQAAGLTETQINPITNRLMSANVTLNTYYLLENDYGYTYERIVNTAEHELGHAIGLNHDDNEDSVMQSSGSYFGIQDVDVQAVQTLYQE